VKVTATDTIGNEFEKTVKVLEGTGFHEGELILDFGWPVQYIASHLMEHYPFDKPMCIDMAGRNHRGHEVNISAEQMNLVLENLIITRIS
jgi:hypothetical protein